MDKLNHIFYQTGDYNVPCGITDKDGVVVLSLCKICGGAECELTTDCPGKIQEFFELDEICAGCLDFKDDDDSWISLNKSIEV